MPQFDLVTADAYDGGEGEAMEPMDEDTLQGIVAGEIEDAVRWTDEVLSPDRAKATDYYHGRPFGNEEEGRSQIVSTDVRDTVHAIMPNLMRVFFGSETVVEFVPQGPEDEALAKQATDYINYVVQRDNAGFMVFYSAIKDALIRKTGIIKFWWEISRDVESWELTGLDENALTVLLSDPSIQYRLTGMEQSEQGPLYSLECTREITGGRVKIDALPPEEFLIDRRAGSIDGATLVAHRRLLPVTDLIAMGYDRDMVEDEVGVDELDQSQERLARQLDGTLPPSNPYDDSMQLVPYCEAYMRVDYDGDGIAELRKICTIGTAYKVVMNEPTPMRPFVDLCPDPEPHAFIGSSITDLVEDIQRIKSAILRNMMDSLALSTTPRMAVVEGQVNMDDVLNTEIGAIIRMRQIGMVTPLEVPFVGQAALPALAYMDDLKENRTGITKAAVGLDPDVLQSTTRAAVDATVTAAQERIEMIARIFAEGGVTSLFRGLLKLVTQHQDKARMVRLRNEWVACDPRAWNADMDMTTNVGLGTGSMETKMGFLAAIATKQESVIQAMGPQNPVAGLKEYRNTLARMLELMGIKNVNNYLVDPATYQPPPQQAPPDPSMIVAQATVQQISADIVNKQQKQALDREEMMRKDDLERDKLAADILLKAAEIDGKYGTQVNLALIQSELERNRELGRQQLDHAKEVMRQNAARDQEGIRGDVARDQEAMRQATALQIAREQPKPPPGGNA